MEQGKSAQNYRNSIWIIILSVSVIVMILTGLGIWKLIEIINKL